MTGTVGSLLWISIYRCGTTPTDLGRKVLEYALISFLHRFLGKIWEKGWKTFVARLPDYADEARHIVSTILATREHFPALPTNVNPRADGLATLWTRDFHIRSPPYYPPVYKCSICRHSIPHRDDPAHSGHEACTWAGNYLTGRVPFM